LEHLIAIVDDDVSVRTGVGQLIRALGFSEISFASAADFLQSGALNDAACVISDVQMPRMSGIELQRIVRSKGLTIPFIFITAFPDKTLEDDAMREGALCFMEKRFDGQMMIKYLLRALQVERPEGD
jgi:FixJ family two-component response regulator